MASCRDSSTDLTVPPSTPVLYGLVDRAGVDDVVIVEHEDEGLRYGGDLVEQGRQHRLGGRRLG